MNSSGEIKDEGKRAKTSEHTRWELFSAFLLGLSALSTSWASYQSALWDGEEAKYYSRANALRIEANDYATEAGQQMGIDLALFINWLNARGINNAKLEEFYRDHFRLDFVPAFEAWLATDPFTKGDPRSNPFVLRQYKVNFKEKALELEAEAKQTFKKGEVANRVSDNYVLATVIFSSVLFFAGIAPQFDYLPVRAALLILSAVMCGWGIYKLTISPFV